jgi:hypothetical protein
MLVKGEGSEGEACSDHADEGRLSGTAETGPVSFLAVDEEGDYQGKNSCEEVSEASSACVCDIAEFSCPFAGFEPANEVEA